MGTVAADAVCVTTNAAVTATTATQIAAKKPTRRLIRGRIAASLLFARGARSATREQADGCSGKAFSQLRQSVGAVDDRHNAQAGER
ncbi:hypothetical protein GCM10023196_057900 [Actinoallomurus vinaceus]|uniref:Secreted protein n=1 Tax=Actinoallomurus vinaceus TaxID=1080074 RepID=A0ABP8UGQ0_9ACTN